MARVRTCLRPALFLVLIGFVQPAFAQIKDAPSKPVYTKLESALAQMVEGIDAGQPAAAAVRALGNPLAKPPAIPVTIRTSDVPSVLDWLQGSGAQIVNIGTHVVEAEVTPDLLAHLNWVPAVERVSQIRQPKYLMTTQGVGVHNAGNWHSYGYTGAGVKVGILDSFIGFSALMGTELPSSVVARCYSSVGVYSGTLSACERDSKHGTAVAETLFDVAPGVQLYIANPVSPLDLRQTVDWMTSQGVRVINYSMGWTWDGSGDGTSPYFDSPLRSVDAAVAGGALFVAAAGNEGRSTLLYLPTDQDSDQWLDYQGSENNLLNLQAGETIIIQVRWQDSWTAANHDVDLYVSDWQHNLVAWSTDYQSGVPGNIPLEILSFTAPYSGSYFISLYQYSGLRPGWVQLQNFTSQVLGFVSGGSIGNPAESASPGLLAVGAAAWYAPAAIESYSSQGPTPDGRVKPDIVGVARADTVSYGPGAFAGTSQATPHVAGLAALVFQAAPSYTPGLASAYLKTQAAGRGSPRPNNTWGHGFAMLPTLWSGFDADRADDIVIFRPSTGTWYAVNSSTGSVWSTKWGANGDVPVAADYDGDGVRDVAVYRPSTGIWYIVASSTRTSRAIAWGTAGDIPVPADYDGDRKTDPSVFRPSNGTWYQVRSTTSAGFAVTWGMSGDVPVPADYDGDGRADPTVYRPSNGTWYQILSASGLANGLRWGGPNDIPLAGDYDGDRKADPTVFRPSTGTWFQLHSTTGAGHAVAWGTNGDVPIVGDYDGDGKADPTVFRPSSGTWFELRSTTGAMFAATWGGASDLAAPAGGAAFPGSFMLAPGTWSVAATGGTQDVAVAVMPSTAAWTATSNAGWLTVSPSNGTGNGTVTLTAALNTAVTMRTGTVTIGGRAVVVTQAGAPAGASMLVLTSSATIAADASGMTFQAQWTASGGTGGATITSDSPWLTVECGTSGTPDTVVTNGCMTQNGPGTYGRNVSVAPMTTTGTRVGTVSIEGSGGGNTVVVTVTQQGL